MSTEKDLNYWKANAQEDYTLVPISVLRYITELETAVKKCYIPDVIGYSPTKREYFVAKAMQGLLSGRTEWESPQSGLKEVIDSADYILKKLK